MDCKEFIIKVAEEFGVEETDLIPNRVSKDDDDILGIVFIEDTKNNRKLYVNSDSLKSMKKNLNEHKIGKFYVAEL